MIKTGQWSGFYSFSDNEVNKSRGFEKTLFTIEVITVENNRFTGVVNDDLTTGGTEGTGEIVGEIYEDRIDFVKCMPVMTLMTDKKGTIKKFNRKHRPVFYTGQFSDDGSTVSGTWKFKAGFVWAGIIPIPVRPSKGTWSMTFMK